MADAHQKKRKPSRKRTTQSNSDLQRLNSLPWNTSVSINNENNENGDFSLFTGSNELEGGFLSLEEIDESGFELLDIPKPAKRSKSSKQKKQTVVAEDDRTTEAEGTHEADDEDKTIEVTAEADENKTNEDAQEADGKKKIKKRKNINKNKSQRKKKNSMDDANAPATSAVPESDAGDVEDDVEQEAFDDPNFYAWNELRLHPSLMRGLHRLGFKEPTPIQKQCIPAAAHQGKDVIGAAETGSGKTLAFGLPIMQRLLEEREKAANMREEKGEDADRYAPSGVLRALIIAPARELALQVATHLKEIATYANIKVVPIVGGMSTQKQERLLKARPEVVVGTPGRLWELMSGGEIHLNELHSLSFFVLDEADRMVEQGHFRELQSIIDMLPMNNSSNSADTQNCVTVSNLQRKKRQSLVFSATIGLSADFRTKLKRGLTNSKQLTDDGPSSIEMLSQRIGMRPNTAIIDLTSTSILAEKLEESFIECREEDKDAHLYYILSLHGKGRTIVFCTSIAALRHISSILRILGIEVWTLHAQMQQRARLKAVDRFRGSEHGILIATDIAARGLDIPGVRTVIHYQLPHAAEVYVHRGGRTARAYADGCSIALISPNDKSKFASLCRSFSKESFKRFPMQSSYLPEIMKRLSLARQIDKFSRKDSQDKAEKNWLTRSAESLDVDMEEADSEEERVNVHKKNKAKSNQLKKLQQDLNALLARPLQSNVFSHRYLAGAGLSPLVQHQFEELARNRSESLMNPAKNKAKMLVIGQDFVEPLQALRSGGQEVSMVVDTKEMADKQKALVDIRRKRKEEKKRSREQRRKQRRKHDRDEEN